VFEMITHQKEKYGWEFIYMGANQDALKVGLVSASPRNTP